jgi:hypothetical protein
MLPNSHCGLKLISAPISSANMEVEKERIPYERTSS